jgi:hypothetical protein
MKDKREKIDRKKYTYQKEYIKPDGQKVIINIRDDNKICKFCLTEKHFQNFYISKERDNYYLHPSCKDCYNKNQTKKLPPKFKKIIDYELNNIIN